MARRASKDLKPYNPFDATLVQGVALHTSAARTLPPLEEEEAPEAQSRFQAPPEAPAPASAASVESPALRKEDPAQDLTPPREPSGQLVVLPESKGRRDTKRLATRLQKKAGREKRVILTADDEEAIEGLVVELSRELRSPVKLANLLRASVTLLLHSRSSIRKHAKRCSDMVRPPNNDAAALAFFEQRLARIFDLGLRETKPLE